MELSLKIEKKKSSLIEKKNITETCLKENKEHKFDHQFTKPVDKKQTEENWKSYQPYLEDEDYHCQLDRRGNFSSPQKDIDIGRGYKDIDRRPSRSPSWYGDKDGRRNIFTSNFGNQFADKGSWKTSR